MIPKALTPEQRLRAEAKSKRLREFQKDAPLARGDYWNAQHAEREKTERLRALRLAHEAQNKAGRLV